MTMQLHFDYKAPFGPSKKIWTADWNLIIAPKLGAKSFSRHEYWLSLLPVSELLRHDEDTLDLRSISKADRAWLCFDIHPQSEVSYSARIGADGSTYRPLSNRHETRHFDETAEVIHMGMDNLEIDDVLTMLQWDSESGKWIRCEEDESLEEEWTSLDDMIYSVSGDYSTWVFVDEVPEYKAPEPSPPMKFADAIENNDELDDSLGLIKSSFDPAFGRIDWRGSYGSDGQFIRDVDGSMTQYLHKQIDGEIFCAAVRNGFNLAAKRFNWFGQERKNVLSERQPKGQIRVCRIDQFHRMVNDRLAEQFGLDIGVLKLLPTGNIDVADKGRSPIRGTLYGTDEVFYTVACSDVRRYANVVKLYNPVRRTVSRPERELSRSPGITLSRRMVNSITNESITFRLIGWGVPYVKFNQRLIDRCAHILSKRLPQGRATVFILEGDMSSQDAQHLRVY